MTGSDIVVALGLLLVIEGLLYAIFPVTMKQAVRSLLEMEIEWLRLFALIMTGIGVFLIWLVRG
ncbi:MAG: DUF2065 domain-containing protein [Pseudomonadota bacterium]